MECAAAGDPRRLLLPLGGPEAVAACRGGADDAADSSGTVTGIGARPGAAARGEDIGDGVVVDGGAKLGTGIRDTDDGDDDDADSAGAA